MSLLILLQTILKKYFKAQSETVHICKYSREKWKGLSLMFANKRTVEEINDNSFSVVLFLVDPMLRSY
jgi:hypothetical protein